MMGTIACRWVSFLFQRLSLSIITFLALIILLAPVIRPCPVLAAGNLYGTGLNESGQLGDGTEENRLNPVPMEIWGVQSVAGGKNHTLYIKSDGSLWATGSNSGGQLGNGTRTTAYSPIQIVNQDVSAVSAGYEHSLFIKTDGSLWGMGENDDGALGDGTITRRETPVKVVDSGVIKIAAGTDNSLFIKDDGSLWGMGGNYHGELGDGTTDQHRLPVKVVDSGVIAIAEGWSHSMFLKSDGSLWTMGRNQSGQLGDGTLSSRDTPVQIESSGVTAIAAGNHFSLYLKTDGSLWGMGSNTYGQLGDGTTTNRLEPVCILSSGVEAVAGGTYHSVIRKTDGSLWTVGWNDYGQLGDGTTTESHSWQRIVTSGVLAVSAGGHHTLFISETDDSATLSVGLSQVDELAGQLTISGTAYLGGQPLTNTWLGADDPFAMTCTAFWAQTNGSGNFSKTWDVSGLDTGLYMINVVMDVNRSAKIVVPVGMDRDVGQTYQSSITVEYGGQIFGDAPLSITTRSLAKKSSCLTDLPDFEERKETGNEVGDFFVEWDRNFGRRISSTGTLITLGTATTVALVTCPIPEVVSKVPCAVALEVALVTVGKALVLSAFETLIENSDWAEDKKDLAKAFLTVSDVAFTFATLNPIEGLGGLAVTADALSTLASSLVEIAEVVVEPGPGADSNGLDGPASVDDIGALKFVTRAADGQTAQILVVSRVNCAANGAILPLMLNIHR